MLNTRRWFGNVLLVSALLGVLVGLVCVGFTLAWHGLDHVVWHSLTSPLHRIWFSMLVGMMVGVILTMLHNPGSMATIVRHFHKAGCLPLKDNAPILPVSLLGLVAGQSAGPEGALTQAGGSLGGWLARYLKQPRLARLLTLAGMGAGFGAFLGAPVGGAILWLEMLHTRGLEYYEAIIPTVICSSMAYLVMVVTIGHGIVQPWHVAMRMPMAWWVPLAAAGIGAVCAVAAWGYAAIFRGVGQLAQRLSGQLVVQTTVAGLIIGLLGYLFPLTYFYGGAQIASLMHGQAPGIALIGLLLAKMLAASVTIRGHWQGGLIIPHFFMGAVVGQLLAPCLPQADPILVTICCMAGFNAAATQTPLASSLIVLALTGYGAPVPVFLASVSGFLMGQGIVVIENKQSRTEPHNFHLAEMDSQLLP
ncbi:MAG: chloride channel protein [Phycisphaeraceae bacterium]|nr:chloride channel protein [Phycisphaeraceae bacterium]